MKQKSLPAVFMRGGTSKALMLNIADLPAERDDWTPLFSAAMGTPDPYGRQLDGMGGGVSSLSKVCIIGPSSHPDADVDYTFAQVAIKEEKVDYRGNCGNMSSAVGPYAVEQGMVKVQDGEACVRILNTNTNKIIHAHFTVEEGQPRYDGDLSIPGVGGTGSPIRLDFVEPGGASTGSLLPSGELTEWLDVPGVGRIEVSLVDAANAAVFVRAADVGLTGLELPDWLESHPEVLERLDAIRVQASVRMGIAPDVDAARQIRIVPFVCIVSPAQDNPTLSGDVVPAQEIDLVARVISNGQPHRALPLTISLCTAVAARLTGSLPSQCLSDSVAPQGPLRLGMPSGVLTVGAEVEKRDGQWFAKAGSFYRTARRLFDGRVWVPGKALKD